MNFQPILDDIAAQLAPLAGAEGQVASYIPALARVDGRQFGIALRTCDGQEAVAGDGRTPFSIQSISKLFTLTLAMQRVSGPHARHSASSLDESPPEAAALRPVQACAGRLGAAALSPEGASVSLGRPGADLGDESLWSRIGREPSGNPFNSLVQLENEQGKPRNPFINAGAIAVADRLVSRDGDAKADILALMTSLCGEPIGFDEEVAASEAATGFRNVALANFMKSFGKLDNDVDAVLDMYFHQCAISMSCLQLARAANYLSRDGVHPLAAGFQVLTERQTRRINSLMLTCGTYDAAGEFAFRIGLPCKSGVGGGIVAVVPDRLTLAVWSPALDVTGNSLLGMKALEMFVARTGLSVF